MAASRRFARRLEGRADRVSDRLENEAGVIFHGRTYQRIVPGQRLAHLVGEFFPEPRASHNICEKKADGSRWRFAHMRNMEKCLAA